MKEYVNGIAWGEGLRFYNGKLYFSDIFGKTVCCSTGAGNKEEILNLTDMPSGLGFLTDGSLLVVSGGKKKILLFKDGLTSDYVDLSADCKGLNDMAVDGRGNVYVGAYGFEMQNYRGGKAEGWIYHISPERVVHKVCQGLQAPNGLFVTPDGKSLIVADTFQKKLFEYSLAENGLPQDQKVWAELSSGPDGICFDEEDCVWAALPNESKVVRVARNGKITDEKICEDTPLCCALGGDNGKTLFIVTVPAHKDLSAEELSDFEAQRQKQGSVIYVEEVMKRGVGCP